MTNKEYITRVLDGLGVTEADVEVIILRSGITEDGDADTKSCDEAIYNRFSVVLKAATQNVSEGGYSISWNMEAVKLFYSQLCTELGKPNLLEEKPPKVRNRSNYW